MAVTENLYTGDGSTVLYSFTFPYLATTDVKVSLDAVNTTAYTLANATQIQLNAAPASGVAIRVYRDTADDALTAEFFPGAAIKSADLNNNFTQNLYVTQESNDIGEKATTTADTAKATADTALVNSNTAVTTANAATATANAAETTANAAESTANAASSASTAAVNTANTAATDAASAVTTANSAATDAAAAVTTANAATATANAASTLATTADTAATNAVTTANSAVTTANSADTAAGNAVTAATNAVTTANTADTNATAAVNTANAASAAVSSAVLFTLVANVAAIPGSPSNNDYIEIGDSTGIGSFSPLSGLPSGFVGSSGLTLRLRYETASSSWVFMSYFANDSESRYLTKNLPVVTGDSTNGSGQITLNCENNSHGIKIKGPPHSAAASYTLTLPNDTGTTGQALKTDGSGVLSFADVSSSFITQTDFAYTPASNSITLNQPGDQQTDPFGYGHSTANGVFAFSLRNNSIVTAMAGLSVGDSVTFEWTLTNGSVVTQNQTVQTAASNISVGSGFANIVFSTAMSYGHASTSQVKLTSSNISNGVVPIANNDVLRYKTATQKWTAEELETSILSQTDFAYQPSSNTATLLGPATSTNPTGQNKYIGLNATPTSGKSTIRFEQSPNQVFYNLVNQLSSGDSLDLNWNNVGSQRTDTVTFDSLTVDTIGGVVYGVLVVNSSLGTFGAGNYPLSVTSSQISNGVNPLANNDILRYKSSTQKWTAEALDSLALAGGTMTGFVTLHADPTSNLHAATKAYADTKIDLAGGTFTGSVSFDSDVVIKGDGSNSSGQLTLNSGNNSNGVNIKSPPNSAAATYTLTLPNNSGATGQVMSLADNSGTLTFSTPAAGGASIGLAIALG